MILFIDKTLLANLCIPRMSGDDPMPFDMDTLKRTYSPHERG